MFVQFRQSLGVGAFKEVYKAYDNEEVRAAPGCAAQAAGLAATGFAGLAAARGRAHDGRAALAGA